MLSMDQAITLVATFLTAIPVGVGAAWFVTRGGNGIAAAFLPPQIDMDWPIGVQEEDIHPWAVEYLHVPGSDDPLPTIETPVPLAEGIEGEIIEGAANPAPVERVHRH
jgi:hypothetical protein